MNQNTGRLGTTRLTDPTDTRQSIPLAALTKFLDRPDKPDTPQRPKPRRRGGWSGSESGSGDAKRSESVAAGAEAGAQAGTAAPDPENFAALDNTQSKCSVHAFASNSVPVEVDDSRSARAVRWAARSALWQASTLYSVRTCGYQLREEPNASGERVERSHVGVRSRDIDERTVAGFSGLKACGSPWSCPRCAAKIAAVRSEQMKGALTAATEHGCELYLLTFTVRHQQGDELASLFEALTVGWRAMFGGEAWVGAEARTRRKRGKLVESPAVIGESDWFSVVGRVRVTECTRSVDDRGAGWHLHFHVVLVAESGAMERAVRCDANEAWLRSYGCDGNVDWRAIGRIALGVRLFQRWRRGVRKAGFDASEAGFDIREVEDGGAEYVSSYLAKSTFDVAGRLAAEMTLGNVSKQARTERNITPFELLDRCATDENTKWFRLHTPKHWVVVNEDLEVSVGRDAAYLLDEDTGELHELHIPRLWRLWFEWEGASKGRKQIIWSRPSSKNQARAALWTEILLARGRDDTDEEIAQQDLEGETLTGIPKEAWYRVLVRRPSLLVGALDAAEERGKRGLEAFLSEHGVAFDADWRDPNSEHSGNSQV